METRFTRLSLKRPLSMLPPKRAEESYGKNFATGRGRCGGVKIRSGMVTIGLDGSSACVSRPGPDQPQVIQRARECAGPIGPGPHYIAVALRSRCERLF